MADSHRRSGKHSIRSAIRDVAIVVFSILLAFAIDAWWDDRIAAAREREVIASMATDLAAATDDIREFRDHHARVATAASVLIGLRGEARVTQAQADSLLGVIIVGRPYSPSGTIVGSLLGGEGAASPSDVGLRVRLARWRQSATNLAAASEVVADQHIHDLNAYVNRRVPYQTLDLAAGNVHGIQPSRFHTDVSRLLEDVEFENIVYNRYFLAANMVVRAEEVLQMTQELLTVLRGGLSEADDR